MVSFISRVSAAISSRKAERAAKQRQSQLERKQEVTAQQYKDMYSNETLFGYDPEMDVQVMEDAAAIVMRMRVDEAAREQEARGERKFREVEYPRAAQVGGRVGGKSRFVECL